MKATTWFVDSVASILIFWIVKAEWKHFFEHEKPWARVVFPVLHYCKTVLIMHLQYKLCIMFLFNKTFISLHSFQMKEFNVIGNNVLHLEWGILLDLFLFKAGEKTLDTKLS